MNVSTHTVRISNLPEQFDEDDFTSMCQNINPKSKTRFFRNNNTGEMDFKSKKEAERCIEEYDEMDIDGGCLRVEVISIARFLCSLFSFAFCVCVCVSSLFLLTKLLFICDEKQLVAAASANNNNTSTSREQQSNTPPTTSGQSPYSGGRNARLLSPSRGHGQRKKEYRSHFISSSLKDDDADGLEATMSRAEEDLECDSEDERSNIWANIKEMTFKDLKVMFEATIGRKSAYTEKDRAKLEKSTYEILSGSLEGTPRGAHDESNSDDEEGGIGRREEEEKEKVSMGLRFQQAVTLEDFLDGYNTQVNLAPKRVLALTTAEKSKRSSYINYWKPFARIFRDALSDFETLFGDKAGEYIGEFELAMEEALVLSAGTLGQIESKQTSEQKRWKPVASAFISA